MRADRGFHESPLAPPEIDFEAAAGAQAGHRSFAPRLGEGRQEVEFWYLLTRRFDFFCAPVSVNRNAFLKDAALVALARMFRVPTVLYAQGNNLPDFCDKSAPWVRRVIDRTFTRAAGAIVLGERLRFNVEKWLPPERIFVVPTGIEPGEQAPKVARSSDCVTVLYLGNMVREKGVFVLLEAARQIAARRADIHFIFAGAWYQATDEEKFHQFIAQHSLQKCVEFVGPVQGEDKRRRLAEPDLLAFPTSYYYETMGLVLLEAMEAGLPVVTTRRASIPEIIQDGVNGLLVEEQDTSDLAEKILHLANDPSLREQIGCINQERFVSYYTHEHYGRRMGEAFEELARRQVCDE